MKKSQPFDIVSSAVRELIDPGLKDKIVLVTGANNPCGIGAATAKAFAAQGAAVFLTYLRVGASDVSKAKTDKPGEAFYRSQQTKSADEVLQAIRERGGRAEAWEADKADPLNIPRLFDRIEKTFNSHHHTHRRATTGFLP